MRRIKKGHTHFSSIWVQQIESLAEHGGWPPRIFDSPRILDSFFS
jgi:hypothetical protein